MNSHCLLFAFCAIFLTKINGKAFCSSLYERGAAMKQVGTNYRIFSVGAFSFLFAYILTVVFEGSVLYGRLSLFGIHPQPYVLPAMFSLILGFISGSFLAKSYFIARRILLGAILISAVSTIPFFFYPSILWFAGILLASFASGCALVAWIWTSKLFMPKEERIIAGVDGLIFSNILMIAVDMSPLFLPSSAALSISLIYLLIALLFVMKMPDNFDSTKEETIRPAAAKARDAGIRRALMLLFFFVAVITINSGLMYQVLNPAFSHLTFIAGWYWAVPYIIMLLLIRSFPDRLLSATFLYTGAIMKIAAFVFFMFPGRAVLNYIIVDTFMLAACAIFDMFWWRVIAEMIEFSDNPSKIYRVGVTANVSGVLLGGVLGVVVNRISLPGAEMAVIALLVICATLVIYPPLQRQLDLLLKEEEQSSEDVHAAMSQEAILRLESFSAALTRRETEVLHLILAGKSNKEIADSLSLSESTVKTHAGNIYSKCGVAGRAELISSFVDSKLLR